MRTRSISIAVMAGGLVLAACGSGSSSAETTVPQVVSSTSVSSASAESTTTSVIDVAATTTVDTGTVDDSEATIDDVSDEVLEFVAALDEFVAGSVYEEALGEDPEVFVATGLLFCERLGAGDDPVDLLTEYVTTLSGGDPDSAPDELLDLSGWLLGVSVGYLCPEHTSILEEMSP